MADGQNSSAPTTRRLRLYAREIGVAVALTLATVAGLVFVNRGEADISSLEPPPGLRAPTPAR